MGWISPQQLYDDPKLWLKALCGDNEKGLKDITHSILCYGQVKEILAGKSDLAAYQEPHRTELFEQLLPHILRRGSLDKKTVAILYADFNRSKLTFTEWKKTIIDPT